MWFFVRVVPARYGRAAGRAARLPSASDVQQRKRWPNQWCIKMTYDVEKHANEVSESILSFTSSTLDRLDHAANMDANSAQHRHQYPVFLTNSSLSRDRYKQSQGHRRVQHLLDRIRCRLWDTLLADPRVLVVMGDPRLNHNRFHRFQNFNPDEGEIGPWCFQERDSFWRSEQAEAFLYRRYRQMNTQAHLILVSAQSNAPYHRVKFPTEIALRDPISVSTVRLVGNTKCFPRPHPKWPAGVCWRPTVLSEVQYACGITVYGVGSEAIHEATSPAPRNSIRDVWAIENCCDVLISLHNGISTSARWNFRVAEALRKAAVKISFADPDDPESLTFDSTHDGAPCSRLRN